MEAQYEEVPVGVHSLSHFLAVVSARPSTIPLPQDNGHTTENRQRDHAEAQRQALAEEEQPAQRRRYSRRLTPTSGPK